ncbi:transcriptional regulator, contains sigma factor-related N-terminal domain [Longilinea arvoryzae]|uniref:Transcriptional regulator, contains sigma factor-related N-terminal domain n=1 Tax=Longilinea arvoryzae TaxID=360412 RepID=A0A0S7BG03_9CHLR|nr:sugar-binding transcriptional regulator [Longilinea arvoryzae]GAP13984.1 transcriptional regulator, contains sigma factor-related N-terminal domain [Longilinea arvoryzae]
MTNRFEIQLMIQVARMYYEGGLTQQQIAEKLAITRQYVSRLLVAAKEKGIVKIQVSDPTYEDPQLKEKMIRTFGLHDVVLTTSEGLEANMIRSQIGLVGADYLTGAIHSGSKIGIGWGRTLYEIVNALPRDRRISIQVVPLIGGIGDMSPFFQVNDLARRLAETFGGTFRYIYAPAFTQSKAIMESLSKTQEVEQLSRLWNQLDMAITGIGHVEFQQMSSMFFAEHISPGTLAKLEANGAVGDVCGRFYNIDGNPVDVGPGVIGVSLEQLQGMPEVVGIAGGIEKTRAIIGALRGGFIKTLVTDTATAREVLAQYGERSSVSRDL